MVGSSHMLCVCVVPMHDAYACMRNLCAIVLHRYAMIAEAPAAALPVPAARVGPNSRYIYKGLPARQCVY